MTRVLVIDSTGRGHAICDLFTRTDPDVTVFYGPGNSALRRDRIMSIGGISLTDPGTALAFLNREPVEFVFVANIDALSIGYVDELRAAGHRVIGPTRAAAQLEASKERGKRFCAEHGLPTAPYEVFTDPVSALGYVRSLPYPCVVKVDGLTPDGDGAVVCSTLAQADAAIHRFAGQKIIVERRLSGVELSVFALLDGRDYLLFPTARDFKRALEQDQGTNCDGMGSVAPHPLDSPELHAQIRATLLDPLRRGLRADGLDFTGFIYLGLMLTDSQLHVLEINARFGDSEAQAVLPGVAGNFTELCRAVLAQDLAGRGLSIDGLSRCSVALTQSDWPTGTVATGQRIYGLHAVDPSVATLFYANLRSKDRKSVV